MLEQVGFDASLQGNIFRWKPLVMKVVGGGSCEFPELYGRGGVLD